MKSKILFIIDEIELKYFKFDDRITDFWLIREFLKLDFDIFVTTKNNLFIKNFKANCVNYKVIYDENDFSYEKKQNLNLINDFSHVFFRPDPPVDINYINACNIFDFVDTNKTKLINNPLSVRNFNEKVSVNYFPEFVPENIVTDNKEMILDFLSEHSQIIIKPLNKCFGHGVNLLNKTDKDCSDTIDKIIKHEKTHLMVQKYIKSSEIGDKRVMIIGGDIFDQSVIKLPKKGDFKFSEQANKYFKKSVLTNKEKQIASIISQKLSKLELYMVGLDMIDETVIEINVTSPCYFIKEINHLFNIKFENKVMSSILKIMNIDDNPKT